MTVNKATRAKIILDLAKDGAVANEENYESPALDFMSVQETNDICQAFWDIFEQHRPANAEDPPNNSDRYTTFTNWLKFEIRQTALKASCPAAAKAARLAEAATVNAAMDTAIGQAEET